MDAQPFVAFSSLASYAVLLIVKLNDDELTAVFQPYQVYLRAFAHIDSSTFFSHLLGKLLFLFQVSAQAFFDSAFSDNAEFIIPRTLAVPSP